ncbi:family 20 glycosylhydrolase [Echinicola sp. CAU 1574]|uniref:beta-N-acetylhexosaminidase n=1 Tax=Echinicola arenosa TaxID=2774144 RepID=A0ABR9AND1_9BACT|nr:family 20 glycosylhydrolase [Echinicola arenosa]MBD8490303.1 family 20 glycosylhydrolase [Echinicola arenosa]
MKKQLWMIVLSCLCLGTAQAQKSNIPSIIPNPASIELLNGQFILNEEVYIIAKDEISRKSASIFNDFLQKQYHLSLPITEQDQEGSTIKLNLTSNTEKPEAYHLKVENDGITISGDHSGIFYGLQSTLQLISYNGTQLIVPAINIQDEPEFAYRGIMLDVSRHFFEVDQIKKMIDLMAYFKFNKMHWHLTEDQGWRLEIKKYPKLTEISAWRDSTIIGQYYDFKPFIYDGVKHGGYYTQEEAKEVVKYAAERMITVIPEIELPGHSSAALAAYPEFGSFDMDGDKPEDSKPLSGSIMAMKENGEPYDNDLNTQVPGFWGVHPNIYGVKEETFQFLEDVLTEVMEIFPSEYIHIGGDEVPKDHWKTSPISQRLIKKEKLADEHELQSYFVTRMEKFLNENGRKLIGWDEILEGGLAPNATVMSWRGEKGGIAAAKMSHDVIMTPNSHMYFDHYQAEDKTTEPLAIGGFLPLEKVYSYSPIPESLSSEEQKFILGVQANLWTEYIATTNKMEYHLFPRALALSEVAWTNGNNKNFKEFSEDRLPTRLAELEQMEVFYRVPEADVQITKDAKTGRHKVNITSFVKGSKIYYTVDGHKADQTANLYRGAFLSPFTGTDQDNLILNYIIVTPKGRQSNQFSVTIE